jgi:hypothetical protein
VQKRDKNAATTKGNPMNEEWLDSLLSSLADITDELVEQEYIEYCYDLLSMINKEAWDVFTPRYQIELLALALRADYSLL